MAKNTDTRHEDHRAKLKALATKLARKHGRNVLMAADENPYSDIDWLPTGIFALDYAIGGGFPKGRITGVFGDWSSAKTFIATKLVAVSQMICRKHNTLMQVNLEKPLLRCPVCGSRSPKEVCEKCSDKKVKVVREDYGDHEMTCKECGFYNPHRTFWVDMEGVYANSWAAALGVNAEYVDISRPEYGEQAVDAYELTLRELDVDIAVIDSIAALTPLGELQDTAEKMIVGGQARLVNRLMRQAVSLQNSDTLRKDKRTLTQIFINQVRERVGVMFGDPTVRPGGRGQEFVSSVDVRTRGGKTLQLDDDDSYVKLINFMVVKNKTGMPPKRSGNFRIWLQDYDERLKGWVNEPVVVAKALHKAGWGIKPDDGKLIEAIPVAQKLLNDETLADAATAIEVCLKKNAVAPLAETVQRVEKDLSFWWDARNKLFKERLGKVVEDLKDASH